MYTPEKNIENRNEYPRKYIDDFKLIVIYPSTKITDLEKKIIATYFMPFSQEQSIENNSKIILTHLLKHWNKNKSI